MAITIEKEYRLVLYRTMADYEDGDYEVSEYHDSLSAAKSAASFARTELSEQGWKVMIEMQEVEWDDEANEAVDHYGFSRIVG